MKTLLLTSFLFFSFILTAQETADQYDSSVPNHYFDFSLKLVKETPGFTPPVVSRAFGFMGLTLYEAVVPGINNYSSTKGLIYELTDVTETDKGAVYHWPTVANNAMATIIDSLFKTMTPANKDSLNKIRDYYNSLFESEVAPQMFEDSKAFGDAIAHDIFNYSKLDGGHAGYASNFPPSYIPPAGPEYWVPFGMQIAMQPYWGSHRPFIQADSSLTSIIAPTFTFSTDTASVFYGLANQVYTTGKNLTPEQTNIALYWADGPGTISPPGHSISMLKNILIQQNATLDEATLAYAKLGIALSDAFLICWKAKYIYNLCRPVTYIQEHIDSTWLPLIGTPPFPEYPSGHSAQSGAMSVVMSEIFGSSFAFTDITNGSNFGGPRSFDSFEEAAQEAAVSRLYGGIHFETGNMAGLAMGNIIGNNVNALFDQLVSSTDNTEALAELLIYPNPTSDFVIIKPDPKLIGTEFFVLDLYGKILQRGKLTNELNTIALGQFAAGIYLIRIGENAIGTYRIVKT